MTAFADLDEVVNRITGGNSGTPEHIFFTKVDSVTGGSTAGSPTSGRWTSLFQYDGAPSGASSATWTSAAVPDNTTTGGLKQTDPGGGRQKWLLGMTAVTNVAGVLVLYDRLLHISGLDGTSTSPQTVGGSLTRYATATSPGNQIWAEIYTQVGSSGTTITASYTDQDGNSGQTSGTATFGGTGFRNAQSIIPIPLASGDTGVRAVASVTLAGSTGTAGDFGVTIARPLCAIPIALPGVGAVRDLITGVPAVTEVLTDACLSLAWYAGSTTVPTVFGSIHMCER